MTRLAFVFLLMVCCGAPLAAQSRVGGAPVTHAAPTVVVPAPPAEPSDTALAGASTVERAVGGAIVGAVAGSVLSAQDSDCAPAGSAGRAGILGGFLGAIRAVLGWDTEELPLPDSGDNGGQEGPYPFDGENCEPAEPGG